MICIINKHLSTVNNFETLETLQNEPNPAANETLEAKKIALQKQLASMLEKTKLGKVSFNSNEIPALIDPIEAACEQEYNALLAYWYQIEQNSEKTECYEFLIATYEQTHNYCETMAIIESNEKCYLGLKTEPIWWYHPDHLGSSSYLTDYSGLPSHYYNYLPFGEEMVSQNTSSYNNVYRFSGKELDEETGLSYFGARYYNPKWSIWLGVDQLWAKYPNISPYVYCANSPINLVDPDGRDWVESSNGDITWRKNVTAKNHSKTLKEGEIYRGKSYERIKEWDGVTDSKGNTVNNIVLEEYESNKKMTYSELQTSNVSIEGSMRQGNSKLGDVEVKIYLTFANNKTRYMDEVYDAVAGGFGNGAPENGDYTINNYQDRSPSGWYNKGMNNNDVGFSFNLNPTFSTGRTDLRIHPDGNNEGTLGCIGMSGNNSQLLSFRDNLRLVQKYHPSVPATINIIGNPNNNGRSGAKIPNVNE